MKVLSIAMFVLFSLTVACDDPCDVCSSPDDLVGDWTLSSATRAADATMSFGPSGNVVITRANDVEHGEWTASERTLNIVVPNDQCVTEARKSTYFIDDDVLYGNVFVPVGSHRGIVGQWERNFSQFYEDCNGTGELVEWNATMDLRADGTGTAEEDLPFGRERLVVHWRQEGDLFVLEYTSADPDGEFADERRLYLGGDTVLTESRFERVE